MENLSFYVYEKDGKLVEIIHQGKVEECCCQKLTELVPNTSEGAGEKHKPVVKQDGNCIQVNVGSILHPMGEEHSITWVLLETDRGISRITLLPTDTPSVSFFLPKGETALAVYAYCNLHGLWKTEC